MFNGAAAKSISEDSLEFYDDTGRVAINLVPFGKAPFIPWVGEIVILPGQGPKYGAGTYRVTKVEHLFFADAASELPPDFGPGVLKKITLRVEKLS
jgi:hypothetical protein